MSDARLIALEVARFKSYEAATKIELAPLTVLVGRNNSGKSTLIQALLLLKQTLAHRRLDVPLFLEGAVDALTLRELTYGWPEEADRVEGPELSVRWRSRVYVPDAYEVAGWPDVPNLIKFTGLEWLGEDPKQVELETELRLTTAELNGRLLVEGIILESIGPDRVTHRVRVARRDQGWRCWWDGEWTEHIQVELDHFLPFLQLDRQGLGPRHRERAWHTGFLILFAQPLEDLRAILEGFQYLGSTRMPPPSVYRSTGVAPEELGVGGEYAAELIHARQADLVHYLAPLAVRDGGVEVDSKIETKTFVEAVNDILAHLGVTASLRLEDVPNIGFRLLFGNASLAHVGRGLTYLLPLVELGLFADPLRFRAVDGVDSLTDYRRACSGHTHIAFEEPEAHIHPKIQSRLAHWMVALAMANRQLIVETHSDHLVRRLRGLVARAAAGSELETWLRENVTIVEVEQHDGRSSIRSSRLTPEGSLGEHWPADFMDEASEEESAIYYAGLDKPTEAEAEVPRIQVEHDVGEEPEVGVEP
jgi:energy-coupling factor transporter ATP-binding protein EcfA2